MDLYPGRSKHFLLGLRDRLAGITRHKRFWYFYRIYKTSIESTTFLKLSNETNPKMIYFRFLLITFFLGTAIVRNVLPLMATYLFYFKSWQNSRLCWNESKYVETIINVAPTRVWTPDILLYNR